MKITTISILTLFAVTTMNAQNKSHLDKTKPIEERIDLLMKQMTLEEKVGQMNQYNGFWEVTGPAPKGGTAELKYELYRHNVGDTVTIKVNRNGFEKELKITTINGSGWC